MTKTSGLAVDTAVAYFRAWTGGDIKKAEQYFADTLVCDAPRAGHVEGAATYKRVLEDFMKLVTGGTLIAAFGDDSSAMLYYEIESTMVKKTPIAEYVKVKDGKITYVRILFDQTPWHAARKERGIS